MKHGKAAIMGMAVSLALIVGYVESLIPFYFGIPGAKLGLTNIVILVLLYTVGNKEAATVSIVRIVLSGFLFGNLFGILYSLAGAGLSLLSMTLLKKKGDFSIKGVSIAGGVTHNLGQICVAALVMENFHLFYYLPMLLIAGVITGAVIGTVGELIIIRKK